MFSINDADAFSNSFSSDTKERAQKVFFISESITQLIKLSHKHNLQAIEAALEEAKDLIDIWIEWGEEYNTILNRNPEKVEVSFAGHNSKGEASVLTAEATSIILSLNNLIGYAHAKELNTVELFLIRTRERITLWAANGKYCGNLYRVVRNNIQRIYASLIPARKNRKEAGEKE